MGSFSIQDRQGEGDELGGPESDRPFVALAGILTAIDDAWDIEADDDYVHEQILEAFSDLFKLGHSLGWEIPLQVDQVFDMDQSGVIVRWRV